MSAFFVGKETIHALLHAVMRLHNADPEIGGGHRCGGRNAHELMLSIMPAADALRPPSWRDDGQGPHPVCIVGRGLLAENVYSLQTRHPGVDWAAESGIAATYIWRPSAQAVEVPREQLLGFVARLADCVEYQSCESDDYHKSWAYLALLKLVYAAAQKAPGYDETPWGLNEPAPTPKENA